MHEVFSNGAKGWNFSPVSRGENGDRARKGLTGQNNSGWSQQGSWTQSRSILIPPLCFPTAKAQICSGFLMQILLLAWLGTSDTAGVAMGSGGAALGVCGARMNWDLLSLLPPQHKPTS